MKKLKLLGVLLIGVGILVFTSSAVAGPGTVCSHGGGDWALKKTERMQERLGLSDEQANKVYSIFSEGKTAKEKCKALESFTAKRDCLQSKRDAKKTAIAAVLNDKQKTEYEAMQAELKERHGRWKGAAGK